ncbi:hypothetical protein ACVOMS_31940 [Bradyrhizobium guangxiense]
MAPPLRRTLARDSLRLAGLIASILLPASACAQHASPLDARFLLGVGTHQGLGGPVSARGYVPAENVAQIKQLGLNAFRDDFPWSDFELAGRRMGFTSRLGRLEAQVKSGVARPLLILAFGHHLVPNSSPPTTDDARQRFADYAAAAAQSVLPQHPLFELWNEWNLASKKDAAFSPENYLALAAATRPAVKRVAPNAPFLVGALGDDPGWTWTEKMLRTGVLQYADGASIHLYNFCMGPSKRTSAEIIDRVTAFHRLVGQASGNPDFPVYITETGWTTASNKCGVSEQAQADNTAQLILWAATATSWLKGMWLYEAQGQRHESVGARAQFRPLSFRQFAQARRLRGSGRLGFHSLQPERRAPRARQRRRVDQCIDGFRRQNCGVVRGSGSTLRNSAQGRSTRRKLCDAVRPGGKACVRRLDPRLEHTCSDCSQ